MSRPEETELKLEIPPNRVATLARSRLLKRSGTKPKKPSSLISVYFDNDKQKLRRKRVSLRVRRMGGRFVQTIKQVGGGDGGLFDRGEWECEVEGERPDFGAARGTALEPLLSKKLRHSIKPLFETRVRRQVYPIDAGGSEIELAVDRGTIVAEHRSAPVCEVELELKRGDAAQLFEVACAIGKEIPAQLSVKSKAERGYELVDGESPRPVKATPVGLTPDITRGQAFKIIARSCLRQIVANEPALRAGDREAVHQMRVGLRRLRSAISLFSEMLAGAQTETMKAEFKWIGEQLGPARQLDVFIKHVVKPVEADRRKRGVDSVAHDVRRQLRRSITRAQEAIESARFRQAILDAASWIEAGDWVRNENELARARREVPISVAAAEELKRRRKKIAKQGARLAKLEPRRRHKLRINAKKLRYACEFFAGAFPGKKAARRRKDFVAALKGLQDALGDLNDIVAHEQLTERVADSKAKHDGNGAGKAFAAGRLSGREEARFAATMKDAERAYGNFSETAAFWT